MISLDKEIAARFASRNIRFYHAENLRGFRTYCRAHALLSREGLMAADPNSHTVFYSDDSDRRLGALGRIFGNIYDFGSIFARAPRTTPNIYGPIALVFRSDVFALMADICITPKSIATLLDSWRINSVSDSSALDALLNGDPINREFRFAELSCSNRVIPFSFLERIIVEPITVCGTRLIDLVRESCRYPSAPCEIIERPYSSLNNHNIIRDLATICNGLPMNLTQDNWSFDEQQLPPAFSTYPANIKNRACLWAQYFFFGTTDEVRMDLLMNNEDDDRTNCHMCDPGDERPPAMVNYQPVMDDHTGRNRLDHGRCDWCNGITLRCKECENTFSVYENQYGVPISCPGECGLRVMVESDYDPRDGGGGEYVDILPDLDPNEVDPHDIHR